MKEEQIDSELGAPGRASSPRGGAGGNFSLGEGQRVAEPGLAWRPPEPLRPPGPLTLGPSEILA